MAVTRGPLFSLEASGSIAHTITFSRWKGRPYVRETVTPSNPNTIGQKGARSAVRFGSQRFAFLTAPQKALWAAIAAQLSITSIGAFVRDGGRRRLNNLYFRTTPTGAGGTPNSAPVLPVATGSRRQVVFDWTDSLTGVVYSTIIYQGASGFTAAGGNVIRMMQAGIGQITLTGFAPGTYFFRMRHANDNGTIGVLTSELTATVT